MDTQEDVDYESVRPARVSVRGNGNFTSGRDMHIGGPLPPAAGHPQALACPQCRNTTWRGTQLCIHCHYDVHAWQGRVAQQHRRALHVARLKRMVAICAIAAPTCFGVSRFFTGLEQAFFIGLAVVFAAGAFKALEAWLG